MAIKSENEQEARERLLGMSEMEREGAAASAEGQSHEGFLKAQQDLAVRLTEAREPIDQLEIQRREAASKAAGDTATESRSGNGGEGGESGRSSAKARRR